jgi:hypothetical protein
MAFKARLNFSGKVCDVPHRSPTLNRDIRVKKSHSFACMKKSLTSRPDL